MNLELPELDTRSLMHVVEENYVKANLKTFPVRMIYTGEHTLSHQEMTDYFRKSVQDANSGYCDKSLTGLLLMYDSYFIHIIEGSEDTIHRQLRFLFQHEKVFVDKRKKEVEELERIWAIEAEQRKKEQEEKVKDPLNLEEEEELIPEPDNVRPEVDMFKNMKLIMVYHSVRTTLFRNWRAVYGKPFTLVSKLDIYATFEEHMEQLQICIDKLNHVIEMAIEDPHLKFEDVDDPKTSFLPEVGILEFLLVSKYILNLRDVAFMHRRVDDYYLYSELVWPIPNAFTPRYLYKVKIDDSFVEQLPIMPWEIIEQEEKEAAEKEQMEGFDRSSSSD